MASAIHSLAEKIETDLQVGLVCPRVEATTAKANGRYYQLKGAHPLRHIPDVAEEIKHLNGLEQSLAKFRADCDAFQKECSQKLDKLSIWNPTSWCQLIAETIDLVIIQIFMEPIISVGSIRKEAFYAEADSRRVEEQIQVMKSCSLVALEPIKDVRAIDACELLGRISPQDNSHLAEIGKRLLAEGAYQKAAESLKDFLTISREHVKLYVQALNGAKAFAEAQKVIESHPEVEWKLDGVDCLVGLGKFAEAKSALLLQEKTEEAAKRLFFLTLREEVSKGKKASFEDCKRHYYKLEDSATDFWLACFESQKLLHDNQEIGKMVLNKLLKLASKTKCEILSLAIARLKADVQKLGDATRYEALSGSYRDVLMQAKQKNNEEKLQGTASPFAPVGLIQRKELLGRLVTLFKLPEERQQAFAKELDFELHV